MRTRSSVLHQVSRVAASLALCAGMLAVANPAVAAAVKPSDAEIRASLSRISNGTWSEADIDLLKQVPEVGRLVPDPRDPGTLTAMPAQPITPSDAIRSDFGTQAINCWNQWSYVEQNDIFGSRIYRFNIETDWCYDTVSYNLVRVDRAVGYISHVAWGIYHRGWQVDSFGVRSNPKSGWHDKRANIEYCVGGNVGCYTATYPYINIELGSTAGSYPWSWKVEASSPR
ncbi:hypothetical protein ACN27F_15000 [Solwaraspora sp. WMMB335]|uniref:hypothetical protein n=1 Tax=Solwaraspora sp. WMMB335 TaxID=3404118 RepID=UPI003B928587